MTDLATGAASAASEPTAIANVQTVETTAPSQNPMERITQTMSEAYDKINQPRDNGKFSAKDKSDATEGAEALAAEVQPETETKDQNPIESATEPPKTAAIDPPLSWSAEKKALWPSLSPDAQSYIAQREGEAHKRISELGQQVKAVEPIRKVVEYYQDTFTRNGIDPEDGIARMLNVEAMLQRDPEGTIREIAKAYGVSLASAYGEPGNQSDDYVRQLEARVAKAERLASETHNRITARERSEMEMQQASLADQIVKFADGKPHFEKVRIHMAALMQSGAAETLEDAYDMAVYALPETRKAIEAEREKARTEKQAEEQKKKATEAKKIGSLNVKSSSASPAKRGSWEQTLREVGERIA